MKNTRDYHHLNLEERVKIYALSGRKVSLRNIALELGRNVGTISRELKRNRSRFTKLYEPIKAQEIADKREIKQRTKAPLKNPGMFLYVREKLRSGWSPQTISGRLPIDCPGQLINTETIYQYIYGKGKRYCLWRFLNRSHKKRRLKSGRRTRREKAALRIPGAVSIENRSSKANRRVQAGHLETDLMEGRRKESSAISVMVDRKTRYTLLKKAVNKRAETKEKILLFQLKTLQSLSKQRKPIARSVTADNGTENTCHTSISQKAMVKFYFCHPYHSWEKGTVENMIGRLRKYIPRGASIHKLTDAQIQWTENTLNNTPRKCLNFFTPNEALEREANSYKFRKYRKQKETTVALQLRM